MVAAVLATLLASPVQARAQATRVAQMHVDVEPAPPVSAPPPAQPRIESAPPVQNRLEAAPASEVPRIVAPPVSRGSLAVRDGDAQAVQRELGVLQRAAQSPAATARSAQAAWLLGLVYLHGAGVRRDTALAQQWFERAARTGREPWAHAGLAWCALEGCVGPPNAPAAARAIAQLRASHPARADYLAWVLASRQTPLRVRTPGVDAVDTPDEVVARNLLLKSASAGDLQANVELGLIAAVQQQPQQAEEYFRRAGPQSQAAQANLQVLKNRDATQAPGSKSSGGDTGSANAALAMAYKYHRGEGVPANFAEAIRFYQLAEARGSVEARRMLALINSRPAPGGGLNPGWMQQLAYVDPGTAVPTLGVGAATHMMQREPTPLFDLLPPFWRRQLSLVSR
ncbi:hypothetical protein [Ottowia sp.]|uniref:hypothetical protein n=1 Tax=Ottowia sp. TaxID=1898956 RepID=UPI0039E3F2C5